MRTYAKAAALLLVIALIATAAANTFAGTFDGQIDAGAVQLELVLDGSRLTGTLLAPGLRFELDGQHLDSEAYGLVHTAQGTANFEAYLQGDTLGLYLYEVDAAGEPLMDTVVELLLTRRAPAAVAPPAGKGAIGAGSPPASGSQATSPSPVLATGAYGTLTEDGAAAFIEALEFVLAQLGYAYEFSAAERSDATQAIASYFPTAEPLDQQVLADARNIWERVKVNWPVASESDRREFALGVLVLAFGEETVAAWVNQAGGGGGQALGSGSCTSFEDCTSSFVDEGTWTDTFNAQGCWAAAGCNGYDSSTGSFDYGEY